MKIKSCFLAVLCALWLLGTGSVRAQLADSSYTVAPTNLPTRLSKALAQAVSYQYGESRVPLFHVDVMVQTALNHPELLPEMEKQFIGFLRSEASLPAKQFICRKLSIMGSKRSVPVLADLLEKEETSDFALYALERIPDPAIDKVLIKALDWSSDRQKIGIINCLGARKSEAGVKKIAPLMFVPEPQLAEAALGALAEIANEKALQELKQAMHRLDGPMAGRVMAAYLKALNSGKTGYDKVQIEHAYRCFLVPDAVRADALTGLLRVDPDKAGEIIEGILAGGDDYLTSVALGSMKRFETGESLTRIAALLPTLRPVHQIQLLGILAELRRPETMPWVKKGLSSDDPDVRTEAVKALEFLGDVSCIPILVEFAAAAGPEREAARHSLYRISCDGADSALLSLLTGERDAYQKVEVLKAVAERNMTSMAGDIIPCGRDDDAAVRREALQTLGRIAPADYMPQIITLLLDQDKEALRREGENTVVLLARRSEGRSRAAGILSVLPTVSDPEKKASLLRTLGPIGDPAALPVLRKNLAGDDISAKAAIQALSQWPGSEPLEDLWQTATTASERVQRILALRGYIGLVRAADDISEAEKVHSLEQAFHAASENNEKRMVLSAWGETNSPEAFTLAAAVLSDDMLRGEAEAAVIKIGNRIWKDNPDLVRDKMNVIVKVSDNESTVEQARQLLKKIADM